MFLAMSVQKGTEDLLPFHISVSLFFPSLKHNALEGH